MISWLGLGFLALGLGLLWAARRMGRRRAVIGERGVVDPDLGLLRWDQIEGGYRPSPDGECVRVRVRVGERLRRRLARRRSGPLPETVELELDLRRTGWTPVELLQEILARGRSPAPSLEAPNDA